MDSTSLEAARNALVSARRSARAVDPFPPEWRPRDPAEAYRLQAAVAEELGQVGGWKIAAVTAAQRAALGVPRPIAAPVMAEWMRDASTGLADFRIGGFVAAKLECEFAFELARDLPPRPDAPYARSEVEDAVAGMRLAIEIVDSRLPAGLGVFAELADAFNNGGLVVGARMADWKTLAFRDIGIVLHASQGGGASSELAKGSGAAILDGDPFGTVVLLANAQPAGGAGLRAGDIVTTGSCSGAPFLPGPGLYRADFAGLGSVSVRFVD